MNDNSTIEVLRKCPACLNSKVRFLGHMEYALFDNSPLHRNVDVVACDNCGFVYYDSTNTESDYGDFYAHHYCIDSYHVDQNILDDYFNKTADIISGLNLRKDICICDVGCGNGKLLQCLKTMEFTNLCGIDCHSSPSIFSKQGIEYLEGDLVNFPKPDSSVELIILSQVMEHLLRPVDAVGHIRAKLKAGGIVYIEVPDASRYALYSNYSPFRSLMVEHINHFDKHHLQEIFVRQGFSVIEQGTRLRDSGAFYPGPVIYAFFKKEDTPLNDDIPNADFSLATKVADWFAEPNDCLKTLLSRPVYIWGISYRTMVLMGMSPIKGCNIKALVDSNPDKQNKTINGMPVSSPEIFHNATSDDVVLITPCFSSIKMYSVLIEQYKFQGECIIL